MNQTVSASNKTSLPETILGTAQIESGKPNPTRLGNFTQVECLAWIRKLSDTARLEFYGATVAR